MEFIFGIFFGCFAILGIWHIVNGIKGNEPSYSFTIGFFSLFVCMIALVCAICG